MHDTLKKPVPKGVVRLMEIILWAIICAFIVRFIWGDAEQRTRDVEFKLRKLHEEEMRKLEQRYDNGITKR